MPVVGAGGVDVLGLRPFPDPQYLGPREEPHPKEPFALAPDEPPTLGTSRVQALTLHALATEAPPPAAPIGFHQVFEHAALLFLIDSVASTAKDARPPRRGPVVPVHSLALQGSVPVLLQLF